MKTFTTLKNLATNLSNNTSTDNDTLMGQLINDQHRYLLQKYFDNEKTVQTTTVGGQSLTLTGTVAIAGVSATLTAAWTYPTNSQLVNFSNGEQRTVLFTNSSTAITWVGGLTASATTAITSVGLQGYRIPVNVSKIKNNTISVGQLKYMPTPIQTRNEWDLINTLPYTSDIPNYYFIYNGRLEIFPIPSTTGNLLTFNYQTKVNDMSYADFSTGTMANGGMVVGSTAVTGVGTSWAYPADTDLAFENLHIRANSANGGDGLWYPISQVLSTTTLTLANPVINAPSITTATTYTIGQMPLLSEDFHDMLVFGALKIYFNSIVPDPNKFKEYDNLYKERLELLEAYGGTKQVSVDLGVQPAMVNPNLFLYGN